MNTPINHPYDQSAGTRWRLDPASSHAEFRVPHFWGLVSVKGHFDRLDGWLEVAENRQRRIELTIDAVSLDTGNRKRDQHLRSADFFDAEDHPEVRFESTSVTDAADGQLKIEGELQAAGKRVPVALQAAIQQTADYLELEAATTVDQRQLGMTWSPVGITRTPATLTVHARLRREA